MHSCTVCTYHIIPSNHRLAYNRLKYMYVRDHILNPPPPHPQSDVLATAVPVRGGSQCTGTATAAQPRRWWRQLLPGRRNNTGGGGGGAASLSDVGISKLKIIKVFPRCKPAVLDRQYPNRAHHAG